MPARATHPRPDAAENWRAIAPAAFAALAGVIVFHRALGYFFSQDDFLGLARASGLAPRLTQPWRYLVNLLMWDVMRPVGATHAWPYHLLSLALHTACVMMLYRLLASRLSPWAALLGATFFAVHPFLFAAVYWISAAGDPLALCLGLAALMLQQRADRWRWLAVPVFGLSLTAKESLLLLPAVVAASRWLVPAAGEAPRTTVTRRVDGVVIALAAVALAYSVYFVALAYGTYLGSLRDALSTGSASHTPYALSLGRHLWENLFTYLGWSVAFALPFVHEIGNAVDPGVYPWGIGALAIWVAGLAAPRLRAAGWAFGGATWFLFALPILPLANHTYRYYLYAPLAGAAWCVAAAAQWVLGRGNQAVGQGERAVAGSRRLRWGVVALAGLLMLNGALLVRSIETAPFILPEMRAVSFIGRDRIAANVKKSLAAADLPPGVTLLFWSPIASTLGPRGEPLAAPAPHETYWEHNVRVALMDGLAVRVLFPQVAEVRFVREFQPDAPGSLYAVYRPEGRLGVATPAALDSIIRSAGGAR